MKRIIFSSLGALFLCMGVMAQEGFKIEGRTEGLPDGPIYLTQNNDNGGMDTLAASTMQGGAFLLEGKMLRSDVAYVMTADRRGVIPIMLDNADFQIIANAAGVQVRGGGAHQALYNQFNAINDRAVLEQQKAQAEVKAALEQQNTMKAQAIQKDFGKVMEQAQAEELELFKANNDNYVAAYMVASNMMQMPEQMLQERYNLLGDNARATSSGRAIADQLDRYAALREGAVPPNFEILDIEGDTLNMHELKRKVKILDFWASWCAPCRQEIPNLIKIYKQYQTRGLEIISISIDDKEDLWRKAVAEEGMTWKNAWDASKVVAQAYCLKSIPAIFILDENNRIVAKGLRGSELKKKVEELLKK